MSLGVVRVVVAVMLTAHAIAHGISLGWLVRQAITGSAGSRVLVTTWLPSLATPSVAASVAASFWLAATFGFALAAVDLWRGHAPAPGPQAVAFGAAVASIAGIAFASGTWPGSEGHAMSAFHVIIAMTMNLAVLGSLLWLQGPRSGMFGAKPVVPVAGAVGDVTRPDGTARRARRIP